MGIRSALRRAGYDIVRFPAHSDLALRRAQLLEFHGVQTVIDGGAGTGQYATSLRRYGYRGRIISFEPLTSSQAVLMELAAADPLWSVRSEALADVEGVAPLYQAANSVSSSLLPMRPVHLEAEPTSGLVGTEIVATVRLDDAATDIDGPVFVKLDVQGAERRALAGGPDVLSRAAGMQLEVSIVSLYEGDMVLDEAFALARGYGMTLEHIEPGFSHPQTGQLLQFDAMFFR